MILQQLRKTVPSVEILAAKQADLEDMFKEAFKSVCTSKAVVLPNTLSLTPSTSSATKTHDAHSLGASAYLIEYEEILENIERGHDAPETADEGEIQMEYTLISCAAQE